MSALSLVSGPGDSIPQAPPFEDRFARMPLSACRSGISDAAYRVLGAIMGGYYSGSSATYPTNEHLKEDTGKSLRAVQRALRELESAGWIGTFTEPDGRRRIQMCFRLKTRPVVPPAENAPMPEMAPPPMPGVAPPGCQDRHPPRARNGTPPMPRVASPRPIALFQTPDRQEKKNPEDGPASSSGPLNGAAPTPGQAGDGGIDGPLSAEHVAHWRSVAEDRTNPFRRTALAILAAHDLAESARENAPPGLSAKTPGGALGTASPTNMSIQ